MADKAVMDPSVTSALVGAVSGAAGLELIRQWFGRSSRRLDDAASMREKLWARVGDLETQIKDMQREHRATVERLEAQVDSWQAKYLEVAAKLQVLLLEVEVLRSRINDGAGTDYRQSATHQQQTAENNRILTGLEHNAEVSG